MDFTTQLGQEKIQPWKIDKLYEGEIRIELHDKIHSIPKYSVVVSLSMEFTAFIFNWPVPDHHPIYKEQKRSVQNFDIADLLQRLGNSRLCKGLTEDEDILSVAIDPTGNPDSNPNTIVIIIIIIIIIKKFLNSSQWKEDWKTQDTIRIKYQLSYNNQELKYKNTKIITLSIIS